MRFWCFTLHKHGLTHLTYNQFVRFVLPWVYTTSPTNRLNSMSIKFTEFLCTVIFYCSKNELIRLWCCECSLFLFAPQLLLSFSFSVFLISTNKGNAMDKKCQTWNELKVKQNQRHNKQSNYKNKICMPKHFFFSIRGWDYFASEKYFSFPDILAWKRNERHNFNV